MKARFFVRGVVCLLLILVFSVSYAQFETSQHFIENRGQVLNQYGEPNEEVRFQLNLEGYNVLLLDDGFSYDTWSRDEHGTLEFHRVDVLFANAHKPRIERIGGETINFCKNGEDCITTAAWESVVYHDLYPKIDLIFKLAPSSEGQLLFEFDFQLRPGASLENVEMVYKGMNTLEVRGKEIAIATDFTHLRESMPNAFIKATGTSIEVLYEQRSSNSVGFIDRSGLAGVEELIIDPITAVEWSTYYGNSSETNVRRVRKLPDGDLIIAGNTLATNGIATEGSHQVILTGIFLPPVNDFSYSTYLARFTPEGQRLWGTYFGGERMDVCHNLEIHNNGIVLSGSASSESAIAYGNSWIEQSSHIGQAFLAVFNLDGIINWSTYVHGEPQPGIDFPDTYISDIATLEGGVTIVGSTQDVMPVTAGFLPIQEFIGGNACFASHFSWDGDLVWMRYLHASRGATSMVADDDGLFIVGVTEDDTFATADATMTVPDSERAHFLTKIGFDGQTIYTTYLEVNTDDVNLDYTVGAVLLNGALFYGGTTRRQGMAVGNALQSIAPGQEAWYLTKVDLESTEVEWRTYFGGTQPDYLNDLTVHPDGTLYLVGQTNGSEGLATADALQTSTLDAQITGLIVQFDESGNLVYGTYLGDAANCTLNSVSVNSGDLIIAGGTGNSNFATSGAHQEEFTINSSPFNAFVMRLSTELSVEQYDPIVPNLYPNPAIDRLTIDMKSLSCTSISVFDASGRKVMEADLKNRNQVVQLNISQLPLGHYLLIAHTEDGRIVRNPFIKSFN